MDMRVLRTDYRGHGKYAVVAQALNKIGRVVNAMVGLNGIDIEAIGEEIRFSGSEYDSTFPWSKVVNGYTIAATTVTIVNCRFQIGRNAWLSIADQERAISGADGDWWLAGEYTYASRAFNIGSPTTVMPVSSNDGTVFRQPLYSFTKAGAGVSRNLIAHMGVVQIPAAFGD